jgi:predicted RNase H-like nuclease (RuvC/YqgF family)
MAGPDSEAPFRRIEELEEEVEVLRERLRQKQAELEEADAEIERLRHPLRQAQCAAHQPGTKRKKKD